MKNKRDWDLEKSEKKIDPKRIILNDAMPWTSENIRNKGFRVRIDLELRGEEEFGSFCRGQENPNKQVRNRPKKGVWGL